MNHKILPKVTNPSRDPPEVLLEICKQFLPGGHLLGNEWKSASLAGDRGQQCSVNIRTGQWYSTVNRMRGNGAASLIAASTGLSYIQAKSFLKRNFNYPYE
jgi:hypothetical protein